VIVGITTSRKERRYDQEKYIGMDVHQATISVAVMDSKGKLMMESRKHSAVKLLCQIPSVGPIRAALLQTPHHFRSKRQLWAAAAGGFVNRARNELRQPGHQKEAPRTHLSRGTPRTALPQVCSKTTYDLCHEMYIPRPCHTMAQLGHTGRLPLQPIVFSSQTPLTLRAFP